MLWQADFYRRPLKTEAGEALWELVICDPKGNFSACVECPQSQVTVDWLAAELKRLSAEGLPAQIQVFRPQSLDLMVAAAGSLGIAVEPTRHAPMLKHLLQRRAAHYPNLPGYTGDPYDPLNLDAPPPVPVPEALWGDRWRFAAIAAGDLELLYGDRPIPVLSTPDRLLPINLGLASTQPIPGVIIDGGRRAMRLARWLQEARPALLSYVPGAPDGLILEAGLSDRWILSTFQDADVAAAARTFQQRQREANGLHFLLVQPDDTGMTYSGFWLLG
ncbi:MAG: Tab2/Atab2 family RNA-binding protein [Cyanobacteria bacterium J069]|nr:MAG: DUF1092 family protein [Cyanobacteria bacterium J069]